MSSICSTITQGLLSTLTSYLLWSSGMANIESLSLTIAILPKSSEKVFVKHQCLPFATKFKIAIFRIIKFAVKVTRSSTLVSFERASLVEYACQM